MDKDEPKQLKLTNRAEGESPKEKKEKKEKETKGNKWVIVLVLVITIVMSLIFYFSGPVRQKSPEVVPGGVEENTFGGSKVYRF